jgi:hypothetical protein
MPCSAGLEQQANQDWEAARQSFAGDASLLVYSLTCETERLLSLFLSVGKECFLADTAALTPLLESRFPAGM